MDPESALRCWDRAAPAYSASRSSGPLALSSLYERVVEELLGEVRGKRVLDAGCGNGHLARKRAARGACVSAVDGSREMVALAIRHPGKGEVYYCVADLTKGLPMARASFNLVVANMVLMDLPRIDIPIMEFARVLTPGGLFTDEKSRAEIVTCRKVDAELLVERWALTWAQVDRL
jgi:ubiquinone/menaquinone biosynthesis C-methylase UbiE